MPDAITASQTHILAGNSADYREIDQAPRKDVAVCVNGMSKDGNEDKSYMKTPAGHERPWVGVYQFVSLIARVHGQFVLFLIRLLFFSAHTCFVLSGSH